MKRAGVIVAPSYTTPTHKAGARQHKRGWFHHWLPAVRVTRQRQVLGQEGAASVLLRSGAVRPSHMLQIVAHHGTSAPHSSLPTVAEASTAVNTLIRMTDHYPLTIVDG